MLLGSMLWRRSPPESTALIIGRGRARGKPDSVPAYFVAFDKRGPRDDSKYKRNGVGTVEYNNVSS